MIVSDISKICNVKVIGESDKPILLFVHGFGTNQSAWDAVVNDFAADYQVVLFDNITSARVNSTHYSPIIYDSLYAYADDLLAICESLELKEVTVVAHSISGITSLLASIKMPQLFSKLICMNSSPRYINDSSTGYVGGFVRQDVEQILTTIKQNYFLWVSGFAPLVLGTPDRLDLIAMLSATLSEIRPDIAVNVAKTIFLCDHRADMSQVQVPVSLIFSEQDAIVPMEVNKFMQAHIPNCQSVYIDTYGHLPHLSEPKKVIEAIKGIL